MRPFILDFCVPRRSGDTPGFKYDEISNLNVIMTENGKVPFIESDIRILELATKTEVKREEDEQNEETLDCVPGLSMKDGQSPCEPSPFLELLTKTKVDRESDD